MSENAGSGGETTTEEPADGDDGSSDGDDGGSKPLAESSIETVDASCGTESSASVSFADGEVSVTGEIEASDPCHEAVFGDVSLADGGLTVNVQASETDADSCQQCLAVVEYSAGFSFEDAGPERVTVTHDSQGETTVVTEASR